jgi:chemotaxis protein methyltransferase CheR
VSLRELSDAEFGGLRDLVHREAGIWLTSAKKALMVGRLARRIRDLGLSSFAEYHRRILEDPGGGELVQLLDLIATNETHFFRDARQFDLLREQVLPAWAEQAVAGLRPRRVRVWSAACSSGEEPYSLAMLLHGALPPSSGWHLEILATDISTRMLERARAAVWPRSREKEIPPELRKQFVMVGTGSQEGMIRIVPEVRSMVRFERLNLSQDSYPFHEPFDLIFCRNVLIYFDPPTKARVVAQLLRHLSDEGLFFLGQSESLAGQSSAVRQVTSSVYRLREPRDPNAGSPA